MKRLFLVLALSVPTALFVSSASAAEPKLQATVFSFDGKDFVRSETTMMDKGQSAANTKLDESSAAYKALIEKHSYTGPATVFGQDFQANYAPLTDQSGKLTGAVFVGEPKK
jgi:methyl-accepting chemotaxis protein